MNSKIINGGSIAILIDCWKDLPLDMPAASTVAKDQVYQNIINKVESLPNLTAVILATYQTHEYANSNNLYYQKSTDLFHTSQPIPYVKEIFENLDYGWSRTSGVMETDPGILNHTWPVPQIAMVHTYQLEYYLNRVVPHVKNIFFFGMAWNICVQHRPVGYFNINQLVQWNHLPKDIRLFTRDDCVLSNTNGLMHFPDLTTDPNCVKITDNIFEIQVRHDNAS